MDRKSDQNLNLIKLNQSATTNVSSVYGQSPMATPQQQTPRNPTPTSAPPPVSSMAQNGFNQNVSQPMPNFSFNQMPKVIISYNTNFIFHHPLLTRARFTTRTRVNPSIYNFCALIHANEKYQSINYNIPCVCERVL